MFISHEISVSVSSLLYGSRYTTLGSECLNHEVGGFLLQGTFYADDDAAFIGKVFGDVFTVFIIELAQHAFSYKYDIMAYLPFIE